MVAQRETGLLEFAKRMLPRFQVVDLDRHNPIVLILLNRYRRIHGMDLGPVVGENWRGITFDGKVVLTYCDKRVGKSIIVEQVCPANSRMGKLAVYVLLLFYRIMFEQGQATGIVCSVLTKNKSMQRAMARVFGDLVGTDPAGNLEPMGLVFSVGAV
jgi:hypothetical protein